MWIPQVAHCAFSPQGDCSRYNNPGGGARMAVMYFQHSQTINITNGLAGLTLVNINRECSATREIKLWKQFWGNTNNTNIDTLSLLLFTITIYSAGHWTPCLLIRHLFIFIWFSLLLLRYPLSYIFYFYLQLAISISISLTVSSSSFF